MAKDNVVVIGGGPCGIEVPRNLRDMGYTPILLEQQSELGEDIIMGFEMFDAVVQIPYLGIHGPGFVLKHQIVIRPVRLGLRRHLALAEINTRDILSFSEILNIVH